VGRALGPIVTTGIALVGAAVVVANPLVTAPHDVSVPSVRLSAGDGAANGMVDKALLDAIAVDSGDSTGTVGVLKQMFAALVADASLFGGKAVSEVFPRDPAVTPPTPRTAAPAPDAPVVPASPVDTLAALMQPTLPTQASTAVQMGPELQQVLTVVTADTGYVGRQVVAAAIAAAGLTITEPALISQVVTALATGDVNGAVNKAIEAAQAPLRPTSIILDAVRTVADQRGADLQSGTAALTAAIAGPRQARAAAAERGPHRITRTPLQAASTQDTAGTAAPGPAVTANGATDLSDGNKVTPGRTAPDQTRSHPDFAVRDQIRTAVANFGAAVRKLAGLRPNDATVAGSDAAN
jgi:hypothetical protein